MKHFIICLCVFLAFAGCVESNGLEEEPGEQTPPETLPVACASEMVFAADGASFSLTADECAIGLLDATARIAWRDADGALHVVAAMDYPQRDVVETAGGRQWSLSGHAQAPELSVAVAFDAEAGTAVLRPSVAWPQRLGEGARLVYLDLPSAGEHGAGVRLPENIGRAAWVQNGHDSWTFTGVENLLPDDPPPSNVDGAPAPCAENYEYLSTCHGVSWWMGAVADAERGPGLLWGALAARHWKTYAGGSLTHADDLVRLQIVQGTPGDERELVPGETLEMEPIWLKLAARPAYDLYDYAQAAAAETPPLEPERVAPFGWATWYDYFTEIDRDIVMDNCAAMRALYPDEEPLLCQIDDGYETLFGEWDSYTAGFPEGLAPVAQNIRALDMTPGLWMAPLMVDVRSDLFDDHPQWFLYDADGRPVKFDDLLNTHKFYVLDITVPEAEAHVREAIAAKVDDGFEYFKFDFLFVGAYEGVHADGSTTMEAYHRAMRALHEAAGNSFLLASGQVWLPSLGYFHAARDSSDVTGTFPGVPLHTLTANLARYHSVRATVDGVWYAVDPDNLCVRWPLTDSHAEAAVAANYLGGSSNLLGDSLLTLNDARKQLLTSDAAENLRGRGGRFWAVDLLERAVLWPIATPAFDVALVASNPARIWVRANDEERIVALFAWDLMTATLRFTDYELAAVFDENVAIEQIFGAPAELERDALGRWTAQAPAQSVAVFRLTPQ